MEDYGWVPVEVTPAADGSYDISYPGIDSDALENLILGLNLNTGSPGQNTDDPGSPDSAGSDGLSGAAGNHSSVWTGSFSWGNPLLYIFLLLLLPCIEREEAEQLVETAARAAYGRDGADGEGEELLRQIYFRAGEWIAGELKGLWRLRFRYLKAFW